MRSKYLLTKNKNPEQPAISTGEFLFLNLTTLASR